MLWPDVARASQILHFLSRNPPIEQHHEKLDLSILDADPMIIDALPCQRTADVASHHLTKANLFCHNGALRSEMPMTSKLPTSGFTVAFCTFESFC